MTTYILQDIPWTFKYPGLRYDSSKKVWLYKGSVLPQALRQYQTVDFSFERWQEDEQMGTVQPTKRGSTVFKPREHQKEGAKAIFDAYRKGEAGVLLADGTGLGKGLASSTKIPTPDGFKTMGEIQEGDLVYSANGETTKVIAKYKSKAEKFYRITFSDNTTVDADEDHRWITSSEKEKHGIFNTVDDTHKMSQKAEQGLISHLKYSQEKREAVTFYSCLASSHHESPVFIRKLLSSLKNVGRVNDEYGEKLYHPQEVLEALDKTNLVLESSWKKAGRTPQSSVKNTAELYNTLYIHKTNINNHSIQNTAPITGEAIELPYSPYTLGASLAKDLKYYNVNHIPEEYFNSSIEQRLELLAGLLDQSGIVSTEHTGGVIFAHKDKSLLHQIFSLVCSLGWKAIQLEEENASDDKLLFFPDRQVFRYREKAETLEKENAFALNRKEQVRYITHIEEIEKTEEYYCISVDSPEHLYLCTESYIVTHNTLTTLAGITAIARYNKKIGNPPKSGAERATVLIVCPKSVIPGWRQTIQSFPAATEILRPLVINYQQLNKLLQPPASARAAKRQKTKNRSTARHGKPVVDWDYIIYDEAHYAKNYPSSAVSVAVANIAQLNKPYHQGRSPFTVFATATPGSSPLNFSVMSKVVSPLLAKNAKIKLEEPVSPDNWGKFLDKLGFAVKEGKVPGEWRWATAPWYGKNSDDPKEVAKYKQAEAKNKRDQRRDAAMIGKALKREDAPFIMRRPQDLAGWPEQQTIPLPVELSIKQKPIYEEAWNTFRRFLNLTPKGQDPKGSLVEQLRYRQKSSLLKVESTIDHVIDNVNDGKQVFISCEFSETIDKYKEELKKRKINSVEISGRNVEERDQNRIKFQKGEVPVVLCSVVAGISLHAEESLPDGTKASSAERVTICHDLRQNPLDVIQLLGRCHRDGKNSISYFPYFIDTVDEKIVKSFTNKNANMKLMTGSDMNSSEEMENLFRQSAAK